MKKLMLFALACSLMLAFGCAKKVQPEGETVVVTEVEEEVIVEVVKSPMELYAEAYANLPKSHTVAKGECLWWIAEYKEVYNDPFMWPLIYKANRDMIKNPDLIYAGQSFALPRTGFSLDEVKSARKEAGAPWKSLEPGEGAMIPAEMRAGLGYSF